MRKIILLALVLSGLSACKKDIAIPRDATKVCSSATFKNTFTSTLAPQCITEDDNGDILLLQGDMNTVDLLKLDSLGMKIWSKGFSVNGKPQSIVPTFDGYLFSTANINFASSKEALNEEGFIHTALINDSVGNCVNYYQFGTAGYLNKEQNISQCNLIKTDTSGSILWTKSFPGNYFAGNSITVTEEEEIFLLTYTLNGRETIIEEMGTYKQYTEPLDSNSITVYKLDKNGNTLWQKSINNILNADWNQVSNRCNIFLTNNEIFIQYPRGLIKLNASGSFMHDIKPVYNYCANTLLDMAIADNGFYLFGVAYDISGASWSTGNWINYVAKIGYNGNTIWSKPTAYGSSIHGNEQGFLAYNSGLIQNNDDGIELWKSQKIEYDFYDYCIGSACNGGALFAYKDSYSSTMQVIKTDSLGNY